MDSTTTVTNSESESSLSNKESIAEELGSSSGVVGSTSGCLISDNIHGSDSDMLYLDEGNEGDDIVDEDYTSLYDDDDDYMFDNNSDDDYLNMQAQFDNVDLPPGVEASVPWLMDTVSSTNVASNNNAVVLLSGSTSETGLSTAVVPDPAISNNKAPSLSSLTLPASSSSVVKLETEKEHDVMQNYLTFKQFDIVDDFSDHHFIGAGFQGQQPTKTWTKKIHDEWKILEKDLPDTIYVRVYETRMDLLQAVIVGPAGTPYHDGLFVFDVHFPPTYPDIPPMVYYYSVGLRLNPNLYDCGKVCLSLLNTWTGKGNEKWLPKTSTMLQVLVSIQALILNAEPFFNEPGYHRYRGVEGEKRSKVYNENTFILSLKTMIYTLRRPPKHYEDFVCGHFRTRSRAILLACRAYMDGVNVGSAFNHEIQDFNNQKTGQLGGFQGAVAKMLNGLIAIFTRNGSMDCEDFRIKD